MRRVAILISGGGSNMVRLVESMTGDHPARPALVLSSNPAAPGLARAKALGVPVAAVDHRAFGRDRTAFKVALLIPPRASAPDILCLAGFMRIPTAGFVTRFAGRMLNIHPLLLPRHRGIDTHARAIAAGDAAAGCSVHEVTAALEAGRVLGQARVAACPGDTPAILAARVLEQEHRLYPAVPRRFAADDRTLLRL